MVVLGCAAGVSMSQTTDLDLGFQQCCFRLLRRGRRPSVAYNICVVDLLMSIEHTEARRWETCSDGVSEVLAGETGLVTELLLDPEENNDSLLMWTDL